MPVRVVNAQRTVAVSVARLSATLTALRDLAGYSGWDVGLRVTCDRAVAALNRQYRGERGPTDILSFSPHGRLPSPEAFTAAHVEAAGADLGDIVIAAPLVARQCAEEGLDAAGVAAHYEVLLAHGLVHLLGYDHETEAEHAAMAPREAALLAALRGTGPPPPAPASLPEVPLPPPLR